MLFDLALYWLSQMLSWFINVVPSMPWEFLDFTYDAVDSTRSAVARVAAFGPLFPGPTMTRAIGIILGVVVLAVWFRFMLWAYQRMTTFLAAIK